MAGRRWSSVYTLVVELLRPGGIRNSLNSRGKHCTHQPQLHRYRDLYILTILTFLIDTIEIWIDMYNLCIRIVSFWILPKPKVIIFEVFFKGCCSSFIENSL